MEEKEQLYRPKFNSSGALTNEIIPKQVEELMLSVAAIERGEAPGISDCISKLTALFPMLIKFVPKYRELMQELLYCRSLKTKWINVNQCRNWPTELEFRLYQLYEKFWEAYNASGAGLNYAKYVSDDTRKKKAIQRL